MTAIIPVAIDLFFLRWRKPLGLLLLIAAVAIPPVAAQSPTPEYQVKGAFLFNFAQFTEWPSHAFSSPDAAFVIGVLGKDPFGKFLEEFVRGEKVHGHPVEIRRYNDIQRVGSSHVLFIHDDFELSAEDLRRLSHGHHILTVSDSPGFSQKGGIINFYQENNKVRFEVNLGAVREAHLTLSSKLLRLAKICCNTGN